MKRLVEFRCYKLKPGATTEFDDLLVKRAVHLMRERGIDVVAFGQSAENPDDYLLIRAYERLEQMQRLQEEFYASEPWRKGPREAIISLRVQCELGCLALGRGCRRPSRISLVLASMTRGAATSAHARGS